MTIADYTIESLQKGLTKKLYFSVNSTEMSDFSKLSGDYNPLHTSCEFAQEKKFKAEVVYGALIIAKLSQFIGMHLPGKNSLWSNLNVMFNNPLYIDQEACLEGRISHISLATCAIEIKFRITMENTTIAKGSASVLIIQ